MNCTKEAVQMSATTRPFYEVITSEIIMASIGASMGAQSPVGRDKLLEIMTLLGVARASDMPPGEAGKMYDLVKKLPGDIRQGMNAVTLARYDSLLQVINACIEELGAREPDPKQAVEIALSISNIQRITEVFLLPPNSPLP
ncbi:MAG: hypothetical protein A3A33_00085 [Candidatus Yanofskybacteria bacterium RIFCSPLOWO2_01_FULL_49_25]|uniref:Uncharacterized protein n=1 Tax=Candidatus Yanofskybacteria bacterium RIFCSPLOWO2_01_FULL_49_25 TaxID=1802701 RepID=A0A1F8GUI1_9BACT|nr:MAG: hypothetical protein A3A33_00085 [Candidatus Yanofskybacteria bacterium RIFCSPLOWO2_01_FULL_49_25]